MAIMATAIEVVPVDPEANDPLPVDPEWGERVAVGVAVAVAVVPDEPLLAGAESQASWSLRS
jgi:hypothetical protein